MSKRSRESRLRKKAKTLPEIKLRKHLNADALISAIRHEFEKIPEFRAEGNIDISIADALMSAFAMFSLKDPSLLRFDQRRDDEIERQNLQNIYGITHPPCDTHMREICDEIDPYRYVSSAFPLVFRALQRGKVLEPMVFYEGCYLLNLDGTGFFNSKKLSSPSCLEKVDSKTGEVTYSLQMLGVAIVHPDFKEVIPLCPEMIVNQDGQDKNDCERNAAKRFFEKLRKVHPHLPLIVNEDALSPNAPHIRDLKKYDLHFILGIKPGDHAFLFEHVDCAVQAGRTTECISVDLDNSDIQHHFSFLNDVPLNKSNQDLRVNFLEHWEVDHSGEEEIVTYHNTWVTDFTLTKDNVYTIMRGGRARWKVENETFNTLKNQGYHFEHNFGLGKEYLASVFTILMMLAFLVDQTQQLCCGLFQAVWKKLGTKKALWEKTRAYFSSFIVQSMEELYRAIRSGINAVHLSELFDSS